MQDQADIGWARFEAVLHELRRRYGTMEVSGLPPGEADRRFVVARRAVNRYAAETGGRIYDGGTLPEDPQPSMDPEDW